MRAALFNVLRFFLTNILSGGKIFLVKLPLKPGMIVLKKLFTSLLFLLPVFVFAQEDAIQWSTKRLTWEDYLAKPAATDDAAAITSTGVGIEYHVRNNELSYKITCMFSKTRSWGRYKSEYILKHEQGHFDITEIYARKLYKEMSEYEFNPKTFRSDLDGIYRNVMKEKEDYQNLYDHETDYSRDKKKQAEWLERIAVELKDLADYADY